MTSVPTTVTDLRDAPRLGPLQVAVCVLSAVTALVHLGLAVVTAAMAASGGSGVEKNGGAAALGVMAVLFLLSFAGYVALPLAQYRPGPARRHILARQGLIVWTAGNVVAYAALVAGHYDAFGVADKACELALIVLLVVEGRWRRAA